MVAVADPAAAAAYVSDIPTIDVVADRSARGPAGSEQCGVAALLKSHKGSAAKLIKASADELGAVCLAVTLRIAL